MNTFCTIITADHLPFARALHASLSRLNVTVTLQVFITDRNVPDAALETASGMRLYYLDSLFHYGLAKSLYLKYAHVQSDHFRWSLKPVIISYLLENGFDKVLYTDSDTFYCNDPAFLFEELDNCAVLLSPHWISPDPLRSREQFYTLFTHGVFNAGFVGATKKALPALQWWSEACHFQMGAKREEGIYDDQRYLDLFPVLCSELGIIRHKGCNIAEWNKTECRRVQVGPGVLINGTEPIIFIHFTHGLIEEIRKGHDSLLRPYLREYAGMLEEYGGALAGFKVSPAKALSANTLLKIKWRLRLRTRLRSILFKLAERL